MTDPQHCALIALAALAAFFLAAWIVSAFLDAARRLDPVDAHFDSAVREVRCG